MKLTAAAWDGPAAARTLTICAVGKDPIVIGPQSVEAEEACERMLLQVGMVKAAANRARTDWGYSGLHAAGYASIIYKLDESGNQ